MLQGMYFRTVPQGKPVATSVYGHGVLGRLVENVPGTDQERTVHQSLLGPCRGRLV